MPRMHLLNRKVFTRQYDSDLYLDMGLTIGLATLSYRADHQSPDDNVHRATFRKWQYIESKLLKNNTICSLG